MKWESSVTYDSNGFRQYEEGIKSKIGCFWDEFGFLIVIGGLVCLLFSCSFFAGLLSCTKSFENSGLNHEFNAWSGCLVEVQPNQWVPSDNYIYVEGSNK